MFSFTYNNAWISRALSTPVVGERGVVHGSTFALLGEGDKMIGVTGSVEGCIKMLIEKGLTA